jgi:hypothetical protein
LLEVTMPRTNVGPASIPESSPPPDEPPNQHSETSPPASEKTDPDGSKRLTLTFRISMAGMGAVILALLLIMAFFHGATNPAEVVPAILAPIVGLIGTLAGYVAGNTAGAAGTAQANSRADQAQKAALKAHENASKALQQAAYLTAITDVRKIEEAQAKAPHLFGPGA